MRCGALPVGRPFWPAAFLLFGVRPIVMNGLAAALRGAEVVSTREGVGCSKEPRGGPAQGSVTRRRALRVAQTVFAERQFIRGFDGAAAYAAASRLQSALWALGAALWRHSTLLVRYRSAAQRFYTLANCFFAC